MPPLRIPALVLAAALASAGCASTSLLGEADDGGAADDGAVRADAGDDGCPAWLVPCPGACVDTFSDSAHCGACDRACGAGAGCVDGRCVPSVPTGAPPSRCIAGGPAITVGEPEAQLCTGALAAATFTHALCSCGSVGLPVLGGALFVDGFDSRAGPYALGAGTGSVGANGVLATSSEIEIAGPLTVAGELSVSGGARTSELRAASLALAGSVVISGDAFVERFAAGPGDASIGGTLHTELDCAAVPVSVSAAACVTEPVEIEMPCRCEDLAIVEIVEGRSDPLRHDNDEVGLSPEVLAGPAASGRVDLACGHYYLSQIAAGGPVVVAVHGHTAIYVGGSILADAPIAFVVDLGATLDLFVAGTVLARAPLRVGTPDRPSASRLWIGGQCSEGGGECRSDAECCSTSCVAGRCAPGEEGEWSLRIDAPSELAALVAAPDAPVRVSPALEAYGAILASGYHAAARTAIHFDRAAHDGASECDAPPPTCADVPECGTGLSCSDGRTCVSGCCVEIGEP